MDQIPFFPVIGSPSDPPSVNVSLGSEARFLFGIYNISILSCTEIDLHWEIMRRDGETELYTVYNKTRNGDQYFVDEYSDRGISIYVDCAFIFCDGVGHVTGAVIMPMDGRYAGAQVTAVLILPECNRRYTSDAMTLNILGQVLSVLTLFVSRACMH